MTKSIAIGSDDAGFPLKEELRSYLQASGHEVTDYGNESLDPVDYPDVALTVARAVARGDHDRVILVCGTGIGMAIPLAPPRRNAFARSKRWPLTSRMGV